MAPAEPNGRKFVSWKQAIQDVVKHNNRMIKHPSAKEVKAIARLSSAVSEAWAGVPHSGAETIVNLVKDLDVVFYGHVLWRHIDVSWGGPEVFSDRHVDPKLVGGVTLPGTYPYKIHLSSAFLQEQASFNMAWAVILHEMAHALTLVRCAEKVPESHGKHFRTILNAVHEHSMHLFRIPAIRDQRNIHNHFVSVQHRPTIDEPHATSHRRHTHHIPEYNPATIEVHATSHRRQRRDDHATNDREHQNTNTGNGHRKHSKTHDHGHKKRIKTKYPQSAMRGEPSCCTIM
ncbi:hypothetical protein JMJ35_005901 [Cladonia borealis]|uniref:SprT-like domain-containing protein n=1 Tax=Cladonia borealis TaxID=184061 RepID=A0AA39R0Z1_9LECA|nr:hypothetical protein JMJ35_005901 [Cladonia borealis]